MWAMSANGGGAIAVPLARLLEGVPVTERRLDLAGVSTFLLEGGHGRPVVLLHGQGGFAADWLQVIPQLMAKHRVVAPDLPGLGASQLLSSRLYASTVVAWLGELISQTCAEPPDVVGISLGGPAPGRRRVRWSLSSATAIHRTSANLDRVIRYVVVDLDRIRAQWGERWAALQAYDMDRTAQPSVRKADGQLLRRVNIQRIGADQLRRISVPVALIWSRKQPDHPLSDRRGDKHTIRLAAVSHRRLRPLCDRRTTRCLPRRPSRHDRRSSLRSLHTSDLDDFLTFDAVDETVACVEGDWLRRPRSTHEDPDRGADRVRL